MSVALDSSMSCPTPQQALIVKAAVGGEDEALVAWTAWKAAVDLDHLDLGTLRLLPLVFHNLRDRVSADPVFDLCRGMYRRTWYENQLLFHQVAPVIRDLEADGIPTVLLKGAALVTRWYGDPGLRPMGDVDLGVPERHGERAIDALERMGWTIDRRRRLPSRENLTSFIHGAPFRNARGTTIDLHWHVMPSCLQRGVDDAFWAAATPTVLNGVTTRTLAAPDQLLHVIVHGTSWDPVPPIRWCADAAMIIGRSDAIDWARVFFEAGKRRRTLALRHALERLVELGIVDLPAPVRSRLAAFVPTAIERASYERAQRPRAERARRAASRWFASPVGLWRRYRGLEWARHDDAELARLGARATVRGFTRFALDDLGGERAWELPFRLALKIARKPSVLRP